VYVQSEPEFRRMPSDLDRLFVENEEGEPVPYSAFMSLENARA
jgi:HAE1 family hydrophobic/amphiphilic exporter-1